MLTSELLNHIEKKYTFSHLPTVVFNHTEGFQFHDIHLFQISVATPVQWR